MTFEVPIVDIDAYVSGGGPAARAGTAAAMDAACRGVGFVQVTGHGIASAVIDGLAAAMDDFFAMTPTDKNSYRVEGNRGYSPPRSESLSLSAGVDPATRMNDFFEAFNVGVERGAFPDLDLPAEHYTENTWPALAGFTDRVSAYFREAQRVARTLTTVFGDALGLDPEFFEALTDHSVDVLRMNNYALPEGPVPVHGDLTGMGEHTDFGIVTVLWADAVPGLQVLARDHTWHDVSPLPGALLVNLGDLTARLTNDVWMSTLHRVRPPVVDGRIQRRRSAAFFHDGNVDAIVRTLPDFTGGHVDAGYEPVVVADHIAAKLAGSRAGKLNSAAHREARRVHAAT